MFLDAIWVDALAPGNRPAVLRSYERHSLAPKEWQRSFHDCPAWPVPIPPVRPGISIRAQTLPGAVKHRAGSWPCGTGEVGKSLELLLALEYGIRPARDRNEGLRTGSVQREILSRPSGASVVFGRVPTVLPWAYGLLLLGSWKIGRCERAVILIPATRFKHRVPNPVHICAATISWRRDRAGCDRSRDRNAIHARRATRCCPEAAR